MLRVREILGMNARNLALIRPYNLRKNIRIADSKIRTKKVLGEENIPVPQIYGIIRDSRELEKFDWNKLPESFVLKPNRGMGGEGIVVINESKTLAKGDSAKRADGNMAGKTNENEKKDAKITADEKIWIDTSSTEWTKNDFERHILNILDGNFSLQNIPDIAFFEQKIIMHNVFRKYSFKGVPDIRVIVFNRVPVMAMLRLTTKWSSGKANLAQGAVGVGIDLATGITTTAEIKKPIQRFITKHPDTKEPLRGIELPYWDEILEIAIKSQEASGLGFLGVDVTIDKDRGPVLFELNARPGLEIQNVNLAPLGTRLARVQGLKITSPKKGISIAKELFGGEAEKKIFDISGKPVIGHEETVEIITPENERRKILAKMDTSASLSSIDIELAKNLKLDKLDKTVSVETKNGIQKRPLAKLAFNLEGIRVETEAKLFDKEDSGYSLIIGKKDLKNFLIDISKKETEGESSKRGIDYANIDEILVNTHKKLNLLSYLKPINFDLEKKKFFERKDYNPQFRYDKPSYSELGLMITRVEKLKIDSSSLLGKIFTSKREEILNKIELLKAIGKERFTKQSIELYGEPSEDLAAYANKHCKNKSVKTEEKFLSFDKTIDIIKNNLDGYKIRYKLVVIDELASRISISTTDTKILITLRRNAKFRKSDLLGTLAHEIDTHTFRFENGKLQPYKIFSEGEGLASYLSTEEGLAIYNKERIYKNPRKFSTKALLVIAIKNSLSNSFADTYIKLRNLGVGKNTAYNITYKTKRGLSDTTKSGAFTKDLVYLKGKLEIEEYVRENRDLKKLYIGKIGIKHLSVIAKLSGIKPPIYLPGYLKEDKI